MNVIFQIFLVGPLALAAQSVDIEGIVCQVEAAELGVLDGVLEVFVLKLRHLATLGTDLMVVRVAIVAFLVLRRIAEQVFDDQPCVDQQDDGIVESGPADAELLVVGHNRVKRVDVEMAVDRVNGIEYGVAFGSLPVPVRIEIFGEYLPDCIFHILNFHIGSSNLRLTKLVLFCGKQEIREYFSFETTEKKKERFPPQKKSPVAPSVRFSALILSPMGRDTDKELKIDAGHGTREHREIVLVEQVVHGKF